MQQRFGRSTFALAGAHLLGRLIRLLLLICIPAGAAWAATQYLYDDLGRLVLAADSDGSSVVYSYDSNGNVLSISRSAASLVVAGFSPPMGRAGVSITVLGDGFDPDPGANTLVIGGVQAQVLAATSSTLSSVIPNGATTGPVSVTVDGLTASSPQNLVVLRPTISSFAPEVVAPGGAVTLVGSNLNLISGDTTVSVGGSAATITSLSNEQIVFAAPNNSGGAVVVHTEYGQDTSNSPLITVPSSVGATNVVGHGSLDQDGLAESLGFNAPGKSIVFSFDATAGQFLTLQIDSLSITPSNSWVNYKIFSPSGSTTAAGAIWTTSAPTIHLPKIVDTGTHLVVFHSGGDASASVSARLESDLMLSSIGTMVSASTTSPRQGKRFFFDATADQDFGLAMTGLSLTPSSPDRVRIWIFDRNGAYIQGADDCLIGTTPGCALKTMNVPLTGSYTVVVEALGASTMSFGLTLSEPEVGELEVGEPFNLSLGAPGEFAVLTFPGASGQPLAIELSSTGTSPSGKPISITVFNPSGAQVTQASFSTIANINLASLIGGTYSVLLAPADASTLSATVTLRQTFSVWNDAVVPSTQAYPDFSAVELGVKFRADFTGYITGIRFYKGPGNTGTHIGNLWTSAGSLLASATFSNETTTGWQQVMFATPVAITANTVYVASYHAPAGRFAHTAGHLSSAGIDAGPIHLLGNGVSGANSVYLYGASSGFPSNNGNGGNYWVDVVYEFEDTTPPTVTAAAPTSGTNIASTESDVTVVFNEPVDPATVSGSTIELRATGGALVDAVVAYDDATSTITLAPASELSASTSYTATVKGGSAGVLDVAGNPLGADYSWTFTTAAGPVYSVWADTVVPPLPAHSDTTNYELGVKFRVNADGYIAGIRFYKGSGNGGTHVGNLWTTGGALLATATFANETTTGWQQVEFATPVAVAANTVYVASYHAPQGHFAWSNGYFSSSAVDAGPIRLLQDGVSGGNGVFTNSSTSVFPSSTYNASYYWVDILFVPSSP